MSDVASFSIPADATGPSTARRLLDEACGSVSGKVRGRARLAVSELVTNAIIHGKTERSVDLTIHCSERLLRIEVVGGAPGFQPSRQRVPSTQRRSGWGLDIVERVTDRFGVRSGAAAHVWFEIDRPYDAGSGST